MRVSVRFPLSAVNLRETLAMIAANAAGSAPNPVLNQKVPSA